MKTAISIPDRVFQDAERLAEKLHKSRSQMYSEAVAEYVARHEHDLSGTAHPPTHRVVISQGDIWWAALPRQLAR